MLSEAVRLYEIRRTSKDDAHLNPEFARLESLRIICKRRLDSWDSLPDECSSNIHPVGVGLKGKMYAKADFVQPIVDAIRTVSQQSRPNAFCDMFSRISSPESIMSDTINDESSKGKLSCSNRQQAVKCPNPTCKKTVFASEDTELGQCCCNCGTVVHESPRFVPTSEDQMCAVASTDSTPDASGHPTRTNLRKRGQETSQIGSGVVCGIRKSSLNKIHNMVQETTQPAHQTIPMTQCQELKWYRIHSNIAAIMRLLNLHDVDLKKATRRYFQRLWDRSILHTSRCLTPESCQVRLAECPSQVVASCVVERALEHIADQRDYEVANGLRSSRGEIKLVLKQLNQSSFASSLAPKRDTCVVFSILDLLDRNAYRCSEVSDKPIRKEVAQVATATDILHSLRKKLTNAICFVFSRYNASIPLVIRDCAVHMLENKQVAEMCCLSNSLASTLFNFCVPRKHTFLARALCILHSLTLHRSIALQNKCHPQVHGSIADEIGIKVVDVEHIANKLRDAIPEDVMKSVYQN